MAGRTFGEIWRSLTAAEKKRIAEAAGTSTNHLGQVAGGSRDVGRDLAERLLLADKRLNLYAIGWSNIAEALRRRGELV